jgi:hypothetical protein
MAFKTDIKKAMEAKYKSLKVVKVWGVTERTGEDFDGIMNMRIEVTVRKKKKK